MAENLMPTLFLSHGAPTLPLENTPARAFLIDLARKVAQPRAILIASAHWEAKNPSLNSETNLSTIHDFYGFDSALYELSYDAPGSPEIAKRAADLLTQAGYNPTLDASRGRDHGAWIPMMLSYPTADIPVLQISLMEKQSTHTHLALGEALRPLRSEGVLIIGSGGAIHNLRQLEWRGGIPPRWVRDFQHWLDQQIEAGNVDSLLEYRTMIDVARMAHPTEDHFLPLFVALGAAKGDYKGVKLHGSFQFGSLSMAAYGWGLGSQ